MVSRLKFSDAMDLMLLREVVAVRVFDLPNGLGWKSVAANLEAADSFPATVVTPRSVRERTNLLLEQYGATKRTNIASSGITEEYTEKEQLLEEILELKEEAKTKEEKKKGQTDKERGEEIRRQAMEGMIRSSSSPDETVNRDEDNEQLEEVKSPQGRKGKKRPAEHDVLEYLKEREQNRARERAEELRLRREEMEQQREERQAFMALLQRFLPQQNQN